MSCDELVPVVFKGGAPFDEFEGATFVALGDFGFNRAVNKKFPPAIEIERGVFPSLATASA